MMGPFGAHFGHALPNWSNPFGPPRPQCFQPPQEALCGGGTGDNNKVKWCRALGRGKFGETWEVEYKGKTCAGKATWCPDGFRESEVRLLQAAQGPYTCVYHGLEYQTPKGTALLMDLYSSDLEKEIESCRSSDQSIRAGLPRKLFFKRLEQVLEGLSWLHDHGIMFGDLKPDNMLYDQERDRLVFADFGDAQEMEPGVSQYFENPEEVGWGHPLYHAVPDVMAKQLSQQSDMWMLAQTAFQMWTGDAPEQNPEMLPSRIPLRQMLLRCYNSQPERRPTAREFLQFLRNYEDEHNLMEDIPEPPLSPKSKRRNSIQAIPQTRNRTTHWNGMAPEPTNQTQGLQRAQSFEHMQGMDPGAQHGMADMRMSLGLHRNMSWNPGMMPPSIQQPQQRMQQGAWFGRRGSVPFM